MVSSDEDVMSYPTFFRSSSGSLFYIYRQGVSGAANQFINRFNPTTKTWARVGRVSNGFTGSGSMYLNRFAPGTDGSVSIFFCWRGSGNANTNSHFGSAKLVGLKAGQTFAAKRANGSAQSLPITPQTRRRSSTQPDQVRMVNQQGADVDSFGNPHGVTWLYDANGFIKLAHAWWTGTGWAQQLATNFTRRVEMNVSTISPSLSRAQVICSTDGRTYIIFRDNTHGRNGEIRLLNMTTPDSAEFKIVDMHLGEWEPSFDSRAAKERNEPTLLVVPSTSNGTGGANRPPTDNWMHKFIGVLTADMSQLSMLAAGAVTLPGLTQIADQSGCSELATIAATSPTDFGAPVRVEAGSVQSIRFAQAIARGVTDAATTLTVALKEQCESLNVSAVPWGR
jgi:hypothetical protein